MREVGVTKGDTKEESGRAVNEGTKPVGNMLAGKVLCVSFVFGSRWLEGP